MVRGLDQWKEYFAEYADNYGWHPSGRPQGMSLIYVKVLIIIK